METLVEAAKNGRTMEGSGAPIAYAIPVYRGTDYSEDVVEFIRLNVLNEDLARAYRYLVYKFGYYLALKRGILIKSYDPAAGSAVLLVPPGQPIDLWGEFEDFVEKYLIPRLRELMEKATLEEVLGAFYFHKGEGSGTGLADVVLLGRHVREYPGVLEGKNFNIQGQESVRNKIKKLEAKLQNTTISGDALVVITKNGDIKKLSEGDIKVVMTARGWPQVTTKVTRDACVYCGSGLKGYLFSATGRLGLGRSRFPHEEKTKFSSAKICLRCMLVSLFYTLEVKRKGEETVAAEVDGVGAELIVPRVHGGTEAEKAIKAILARLASPALVYNSLLGSERLRISIAGLGEEAVERLSLLKLCIGGAGVGEAVSDVIDYVHSTSIFGALRSLLQILKRLNQLEKVNRCMPRIVKYVYVKSLSGQKEERVALALAKIADGVIYVVHDRKGGSLGEEDYYTLRKFADELRNSGLVKAVAYVIGKYGMGIAVVPVLVRGPEAEVVKEVLKEYGFEFEEKGEVINVYVRSFQYADMKIRQEHGYKVYEDAYVALLTMKPDILVASGGGQGAQE